MNRKNLFFGRDKEMQDMADAYENGLTKGTPFYLDADDWADMADWYSLRGKMNQAFTALEDGLKIHPDNTTLLVEQAYLLIDTNKKEEAWQSFNRINEDYLPEVKILKAHLLMLDNHKEEAEELIDSIDDKEDLTNIIEIVYLYLDFDMPQKAYEWLMNGKEKYKDDESFIAVSADYYSAINNNPKAIKYFNKLLDKNPYSPLYWYGLARTYYEMGEFEKCIEACDYSLLSDEEFGDAYLLRGQAYLKLANDDKATEDFRKGIKFNAMSPHYLNAVEAFDNIGKGNWKEGLRYLQLAIDNPQQCSMPLSILYANMGLCHEKLKHVKEAEKYCLMALQEDPEDIDALLVLNRIYLKKKKAEAAFKLWDRMKRLIPDADTWFDISNLCVEIHQLQMAKIALEEAYHINPNYPQIHEALSMTYFITRDIENFRYHNDRCESPFPPEVVEGMIQTLNDNDSEDFWEGFLKDFVKARISKKK